MNELIMLLDRLKYIRFYNEDHTYWTTARENPKAIELTSCTTLISQYKDEFDVEYWADKKGKENGLTTQQQKWIWDDISEVASYRGTQYHRWAENYLNNKEFPNTFLNPNYTKLFTEFYNSIYDKVIPIKSELVVGDLEWGIAGQVDQLFYSKTSNRYHIADWKTNKKFTTHSNYKFNSPLTHLPTNHLYTYSLQLSIYELIIKKTCPELELGQGMIVWFNEPNNTWKLYHRKNLHKEAKQILDNNFDK